MKPRVLSLCTGYAGLELALDAAGIDHELVAVADPDPAATAVLAHRYPGVPNLGDIATADWASLGQVDILTAGYPCQGFSLAGQRKGTEDERFIWPAVADAVRVLRPGCVLLENVAGHRSLGFGRVLGDLAAMRYVGSWVSVRASDIGAAHKRERVFIHAYPADTTGDPRRFLDGDLTAVAARRDGHTAAVLLPTPRTSDAHGAGGHGSGGIDLRTAVSLLPTPTAPPYGNNQSPSAGAAVRPSLDGVMRLLPTPETGLSPNGHGRRGGRAGNGRQSGAALDAIAKATDPMTWGQYAPAIARWEHILGWLAPEPTEPGKNGPRLAARFVEWLMGLPAGWVCDVPGLTRNHMLRLLGNGVVYQQAAHAIQLLGASR